MKTCSSAVCRGELGDRKWRNAIARDMRLARTAARASGRAPRDSRASSSSAADICRRASPRERCARAARAKAAASRSAQRRPVCGGWVRCRIRPDYRRAVKRAESLVSRPVAVIARRLGRGRRPGPPPSARQLAPSSLAAQRGTIRLEPERRPFQLLLKFPAHRAHPTPRNRLVQACPHCAIRARSARRCAPGGCG